MNMSKLVLLVLLVSFIVWSQSSTERRLLKNDDRYKSYNSQSIKGGIDIEQLSLFGDWIDKNIENNQFSGSSFAVYRNNRLVYESFHGYQSLNKLTPINENTVFRIYSMTKPVIAVGLMILFEKNRFKLSDPVSKYIPSFNKDDMIGVYDYENNLNIDINNMTIDNIQTLPIHKDIEIWHLLAHLSGLSYGFDPTGLVEPVDKIYNDNNLYFPWNGNTLEEFVDKLASMPLVFEPGTRWHYSYGLDVAGRIIEILSQQSLDEYLHENVFEPLNMQNTAFRFKDINNIDVRLAELYIQQEGGIIKAPATYNAQYSDEHKSLSGGAGLLSTLSDYLSFSKMLLNKGKIKGKKRLLSKKTVEFIQMNHLPQNTDIESIVHKGSFIPQRFLKGIGHGLGGAVFLDNRLSDGAGSLISHGSYFWSGAASSYFLIDPNENLCVVFMTQLMADIDILSPISTLIYSSIIN